MGLDHRDVAAARIGDELGGRELACEALAKSQWRDLIVLAPQEQHGSRERAKRVVQLAEVMAAGDRERCGDGAGPIELGLDAIDAGLGHPALVVVRERSAVLDALLVEQPEQHLAERRLLGPAKEARDLVVVDVRRIQRDAPGALRLRHRHRERDRGPPRMSDDRDILHAELVEHAPHEVRLGIGAVVALRPRRPAKALEVDRDHAMRLRERWRHRQPAIARCAVAMKQHHCRPGARFAIANLHPTDLDKRRIWRCARKLVGMKLRTSREEQHRRECRDAHVRRHADRPRRRCARRHAARRHPCR
jgi:hypothetical protein